MSRLIDLEDGGYGSRKFLLTIIGLLLVTLVAVLSVGFPGIIAVMPTFTGGILAILSLYFTGNVMNKYVTGKQLKALGARISQEDEAKE
jgi:hypothetical protein